MSNATIVSVDAQAFRVPTDQDEADGTATWASTTMVLVTVECDGVIGTRWTYGSSACADVVRHVLADTVIGSNPMAVPGVWTNMVRAVRNDTRAGLAGYAISAVDVACWDLKARLLGCSLIDLFGVERVAVPVYGSGGFTTYDDQRLTEQLTHWVHEQRIPRVKIKIGEDRGGNTDRDLARIARAREIIGPEAELYVDANGAYTAKQAIRLMRSCADARIGWFEEPVTSDDLLGLHLVRTHVDADVAAGEYGTGIAYFERMAAARAVDCIQIDATRCGGYTEWMRSASVAAAHHLTVSGHCAPNLHAHVAAATPHLRHLEWFHDHVRIEQMAFTGTLDPTNGNITPDPEARGHGLQFRSDAMEQYAV